MINQPLVSVIIPTYNRASFLPDALASVLEQDYRAVEILVVDDGSTDGTAELVCSQPEIKYIHQPNQGVAAARNTGIRHSQGEFIAFLDSDDTWTRTKLSVQVGYHLTHPEVGYSVTHLRNVLMPGCVRPAWLRPELLSGDHVGMATATMVARRSVFDRVGLFDVSYRVGEDSEWLFRAKDAGVPMAIIPEVLLARRVHDHNLSAQSSTASSELLRILKASFDRRRSQVATGGLTS